MKKRHVYDWENLSVISRNKEDGHAFGRLYTSAEGALSGGDSPYQISLNGDWRFLWVQGCEVPAGVSAADFDDSNWDTLHVPGVWQRQGYGTPYYYAMSYPQAIGTNKRKIPQISHGLQEIGMFTDNTNPRYPRHPGSVLEYDKLRMVIDGYDCGIAS